MNLDALDRLVEVGDLDELVDAVDRLASAERWDELARLRERCQRAAEEVGRQLWGVAQFADYRIALDAPGPSAARVVVPGSGRFTLGPLTEVVAQNHRFAELADDLDTTIVGIVAQECIVRGEDLTDDARVDVGDTGLPSRLQPWEPDYPVPTYRSADRLDGAPRAALGEAGSPGGTVVVPASRAPAGVPLAVESHRSTSAPEGVERALTALVSAWVDESDGRVAIRVVTGDVEAAVAAVVDTEVRLTRRTVTQAFGAMAAAGASGGAHGRRRGAAAGRAGAWHLGRAVTRLDLTADPDELEFRLEDLDWFLFDDGQTDGWRLRLVVGDPKQGWAAAVDAYDPVPVDPELD